MRNEFPLKSWLRRVESFRRGWALRVFSLTALVALTAFVAGRGGVAAEPGEPVETEYRERLLGDQAFQKGFYDVAAGYYRRYLKAAEKDQSAAIDAGFCLIATYLQNREQAKAKAVFKDLFQRHKDYFRDSSRGLLRLYYWRGEMYLAEADYPMASDAFQQVINGAEENTGLMARSLIGLGAVRLATGDVKSAADLFARARTAAPRDNALRAVAAEKLALAKLALGDYAAAETLLEESSEIDKLQRSLLGVCALAARGETDQALALYGKIGENASPTPLWRVAATTLATALFDKKLYPKAIELYKAAYAMASTVAEKIDALDVLTRAYLTIGDTVGAAETLDAYKKTCPPRSAYAANVARLALMDFKQEKVADGVRFAETWLSLDASLLSRSDRAEVLRQLGGALIKAEKYDIAQKCFRKLSDEASGEEVKGEAKLWLAYIDYFQKRYPEALKIFLEVAARYPRWREMALYRAGQAYWQMKDFENAAGTLKTFLKEYPESADRPDAMFLRAMALGPKAPDEALVVLREFLQLFPKHERVPRVWFEIGELLLARGDYADSVKAFHKVPEIAPKTPLAANALYRAVYAWYLSGNDKEAIAAARELYNKYPASEYAVDARFWLSDYYWNRGDSQESIKELLDIAEKYKLNAAIAAAALYDAAELSRLAGHNDKATMFLERLTTAYPNEQATSKGYYLMGDIAKDKGDFEKALSFFEKTAERRPASTLETAALGSAADCCFALAKKDSPTDPNLKKAIDYYEKLLDGRPLAPTVRDQTLYKLGRTLERADRLEEAKARYHEVVFGTLIDEKKGGKRDLLWFGKAGEALARLLRLNMDTPEKTEAVISVYLTLIQHDIHPVEYKKLIETIRNANKL